MTEVSSSSEIVIEESDLGCGMMIVGVAATCLSPSAAGERSVGEGEGACAGAGEEASGRMGEAYSM